MYHVLYVISYLISYIKYHIIIYQYLISNIIYDISYIIYHISYIMYHIIWFYLLENLGDTGTRNIHAQIGRDDQLLGTALPDVALGHGDSARLLPYLTMFSSFIISFKYTYIYIYIYIYTVYI